MSIRAFAFDLYGTLIEDLGRDSHDALLRQMAAVLLLSADGLSAAWRQVGNRRTTGGFDTLEECLTHICNVLGTQVDAERIEAAVELRVGYIFANLRPRDDAVETPTRLKRLSPKIALISDCGLEVPMLWSQRHSPRSSIRCYSPRGKGIANRKRRSISGRASDWVFCRKNACMSAMAMAKS